MFLIKNYSKINNVQVQKQNGSKDYGALAIAMKTSIAYSEYPWNVKYDQDEDACHLLDLLHKKEYTPTYFLKFN